MSQSHLLLSAIVGTSSRPAGWWGISSLSSSIVVVLGSIRIGVVIRAIPNGRSDHALTPKKDAGYLRIGVVIGVSIRSTGAIVSAAIVVA